ncbi:MAG: hypothetical protein KKG84_04185 [Candidatus Omnitrophica bacterium]|nr:hypothetical protein [Candidatus Omnitrophota bacterium]
MKNGWETEKEKILKNMRMSAKEKLTRIKKVQEFTEFFSTKKAKSTRKALLSG